MTDDPTIRALSDSINRLAATGITLANSWANFGSGQPVASYIREGNRVSIYGVIKDGTFTDGTVIGTLPVNFRPSATTIIMASHQSSGAEVPMRI